MRDLTACPLKYSTVEPGLLSHMHTHTVSEPLSRLSYGHRLNKEKKKSPATPSSLLVVEGMKQEKKELESIFWMTAV